LSRPGEQPLGVLVVAGREGRKFLPEEVELAEAFAGFAGTALWNLRRSEFEQRLIGELSQTLDLRREFINSVSHEFRTPLACIMGFAATLMNHWDRLDPETAQRSIERIRHHTSDLTSLVERLLDFARFERGNFRTEMQKVDLAKTIETSLSDLEPVIEDRPVITEIEPAIVMADPQLVHRVLANLISNAAKATAPGQQINIRASITDDGSMRVEVTDEGCGLSKDELERAFDPFWRTRRSIQGAERGSGIGLALVKEYVEAMEGTVGGRSEPGSGSTFFFTLRTVQS
jgi:signal transduction histidine kinase